MRYEIKDFRDEGSEKYVGFMVVYEDADSVNNGRKFYIDKKVELSEGKSDDSYIEDALALGKDEIDEWSERMDTEEPKPQPEPEVKDKYVGKQWDADKSKLL